MVIAPLVVNVVQHATHGNVKVWGFGGGHFVLLIDRALGLILLNCANLDSGC